MDSLGNSASAAYTLDRIYHFGEDSLERRQCDGTIPMVPARSVATWAAAQPISVQIIRSTRRSPAKVRSLIMSANGATGKPKYIDVSVTSANLAGSTGRSPGNRGVLFDGVDDYLSGLRFNNPNTAPGTVQYTPAGPNNYNGVFTRGFQLWVYPQSAAST